MERIRDIMQADVITVPPAMAVGELVSLLDRGGITGAPVVDESGLLLGIVTVRDVVRLARELVEVPEAARWGLGLPLGDERGGAPSLDIPQDGEFYAYYVLPGGGFVDLRDRIHQTGDSAFNGYTVEDIMSQDPVTVPSSLRVAEVAQLLVQQKIHRVLVVDGGQLVGIVTASDILRAVAQG
jgi:CBS domain-containing protein